MEIFSQANRLRAFVFFFHSTATIIVGFLPLFFQTRGLTNSEIGWILAIGPAASIISQPFWGYLSDRYKTVKNIILICIFFTIMMSLIMFSMSTFMVILITAFLFFAFMQPVAALSDSLAQKTANQLQITFGSIRTWGAIGFALFSLLCGQLFSVIGVENIMYPFLAISFICLVLGLFIHDAVPSRKPVSVFSALHLLKDKKLLLFLILASLISLAHRTNDNFVGLYIMDLGGSESIIGWAWFIGVTVEALVFALSAFWFRRFHELTFIIFAGVLYVFRFVLFAFIQDPMHILFIQPLHGICFGIFYSAAFQYITKIIPEELQGTGHLLFISFSFGIAGIIGTSIGGMIMESTNGSYLYLFMALSAMIGAIGMFFYQKKIAKTKSPDLMQG